MESRLIHGFGSAYQDLEAEGCRDGLIVAHIGDWRVRLTICREVLDRVAAGD